VQASLFNKSISLPDKIDWDDVFMEAKKQTIASVVRYGVKSQLPPSIAMQWKLYSIQEISNNVHLLEVQRELTELLDAHGIKYVIFKGSAAAIYYPEPYVRSMGDIDFWVQKEQFDYCLQLLREHEYAEAKGSDDRLIILVNKNDCRIYATRCAPCLRDAYVFSQIGSKSSNSWIFSAIRLEICSLKTVVVLSMIESMVSLKEAKSL